MLTNENLQKKASRRTLGEKNSRKNIRTIISVNEMLLKYTIRKNASRKLTAEKNIRTNILVNKIS